MNRDLYRRFKERVPLNTVARLVEFSYEEAEDNIDIANLVGPIMSHSEYIDNNEYDDDFPFGALELDDSLWCVIFVQPWSEISRWWFDPQKSEYWIDNQWLTFDQLMQD